MKELLSFIEACTSPYQTVQTVEQELKQVGFMKLEEQAAWKLEPGKRYYVTRAESSILAFVLPKEHKESLPMCQVIAAHTDSPTFKIKENPEMDENGYTRLNVEQYGGVVLPSWSDRPLSIAGRIMVEEEGKSKSVLVNIKQPVLIIPNLAIHMNREINKGHEYKVQIDMQPLFGQTKASLKQFLAGEIGVKEESILSTDLYLFNAEKGVLLGSSQEFIAAPRMDDLECVFAGMKAIQTAEGKENNLNLFCAFNHEEVGSGTRQGAASTFLYDVLHRICDFYGEEEEFYYRMVAGGMLLSADNAHAVHPNFPEKADKNNRPVLNGGIVIKYNGSGSYITDAETAAYVKLLCKKCGMEWQEYTNRSDIRGGSTLGHLAAQKVALKGADIGLAQLAMHSAYETAGVKDIHDMCKFMEAYYHDDAIRA